MDALYHDSYANTCNFELASLTSVLFKGCFTHGNMKYGTDLKSVYFVHTIKWVKYTYIVYMHNVHTHLTYTQPKNVL